MILDTLAHARLYTAISPRFQPAFDFLRKVNAQSTVGRHDIDGDNVYALVQKYTTKPAEQAQFEAHRKYIDVQFVFSGKESILWAPLASMKTVTMPFDESKDAALWSLVPEGWPLRVAAGQFTILFPQDAHAPCCVWDKPCEVTKVVVKVKV